MKLKAFLLSVALSFFTNVSFLSATGAQPNVVLILVDDFGFECLSANGSETFKTPNIDRLAATGVRFENCHVQPLCTPTRIQLMTGQYNVRNYVEFGYMLPESRTFGNLFKDAGYATCMAGKWQLGRDESLPKKWGFDEACLWQHTRRPERYKNAGLEINGKEMDYTHDEYGPDIVSDYALDFISRNKEKPFFLYYPMMLTHNPFVPTPDSPNYHEAVEKNNKYFKDMVAYADKLTGKLVSKLEELKLRDNTLVILVGDNGTFSSITSQFRGKPYKGGKGQRTGNGTHVPLVVNWPKKVPSGVVKNEIVDGTDFLPTICEAAGIEVPKTMTTDGKSFWPLALGEKGSPREWSYCWYAPHNQEVKFEFAQDLKYKLYRDGPFVEKISDQEEKPLTDNLSAEAKASREKLAKALEQYRNARPPELALLKGKIESSREGDEESETKNGKRAEKKGGKKRNKKAK